MREIINLFAIGTVFLMVLSAILSAIPAWITHVVFCITAQAWILLVIGGVIPPIGIIHGYMIWFGHPIV